MVEPWLRGPLAGMPPLVIPAAHALMQAAEDIPAATSMLSVEQLWMTPGGAASVGFHLRHVAGSVDRLLSYAANRGLTPVQLAALAAEQQPGEPAADAAALVPAAVAAIEGAIEVIRSTAPDSYLEPRFVGRARLQTTVIGLLVHVAEHTQRHTGQIITTSKIVRG